MVIPALFLLLVYLSFDLFAHFRSSTMRVLHSDMDHTFLFSSSFVFAIFFSRASNLVSMTFSNSIASSLADIACLSLSKHSFSSLFCFSLSSMQVIVRSQFSLSFSIPSLFSIAEFPYSTILRDISCSSLKCVYSLSALSRKICSLIL